MQTYRSTKLGWVIVACLGTVICGPAVAAEKALGPLAAEERIFAILEEETSLESLEEPLSHVVAYLMDLHGIKIQIDERALKDHLIDGNERITKSVNGISLASGLNLMLRDLDLTWTIVDEVLLITTPREAEEHLVTRMYEVGDLVTVRDTEGKLWRDFDSLIEVLTGTIKAEDWEQVGGTGSIVPFEFRGAAVLVICQTPRIHRKIARLLADMSELGKKYDDGVWPTRDPEPLPECSGGMAASGSESAKGKATGKATGTPDPK